MTKLYLDTCECVMEYAGQNPPHTLVKMHNVCPNHSAMTDAEVFEDIIESGKERARVFRAVRRARWGTDDMSVRDDKGERLFPDNHPCRDMSYILPIKMAGDKSPSIIKVLDDKLTTEDRAKVLTELQNLPRTREIELGDTKITRSVS